ncbi:MAG: tRNA (adenosine(37)-N6)-threonylcarbamoyltransferase complex ATPase subunit type 1 TsaE [Clostridia bacterium]|nr:tRNA (adenosine(37)-N6)-threonylcarbamoyltransferase complex ATPase subunit type 1 TsaE [Clostridia bacterium]
MLQRALHTASAAETEAAGAALAREMQENAALPRFVALFGDLGVGKTAFVRGFASVLSPTSLVRSPTFALVNEYARGEIPLFHFDMYRIESEDDLYSIGFEDYLAREGIALVEWSENILSSLPAHYLAVTITKDNADAPDSRLLTLEERIALC